MVLQFLKQPLPIPSQPSRLVQHPGPPDLLGWKQFSSPSPYFLPYPAHNPDKLLIHVLGFLKTRLITIYLGSKASHSLAAEKPPSQALQCPPILETKWAKRMWIRGHSGTTSVSLAFVLCACWIYKSVQCIRTLHRSKHLDAHLSSWSITLLQ